MTVSVQIGRVKSTRLDHNFKWCEQLAFSQEAKRDIARKTHICICIDSRNTVV